MTLRDASLPPNHSVVHLNFLSNGEAKLARLMVPSKNTMKQMVKEFILKMKLPGVAGDYYLWQQLPCGQLVEVLMKGRLSSFHAPIRTVFLLRPVSRLSLVKCYNGGAQSIHIDLKSKVDDILRVSTREFGEPYKDTVLVFRKSVRNTGDEHYESVVCCRSLTLVEQGWDGEKLYLLKYSLLNDESAIRRAIKLGVVPMPTLDFWKLRNSINLKKVDTKKLPKGTRYVAHRFISDGAFIILSQLGLMVDGSENKTVDMVNIKGYRIERELISIETDSEVIRFRVTNTEIFAHVFDEIFDRYGSRVTIKDRSSVDVARFMALISSMLVVILLMKFVLIYMARR